MSDTPKLCANPCETCEKKGLPLLLTRYALMPSETNAPQLSGEIKAAELDKVPLGASARYGLRLLRSGYVYVFDEARKHWDEYFVTADGFLSKMPVRIRALKAQPKPATEFACARNGAAPLAGVITIRNPKHATDIWIAFSDVEWTDAVFMKHQDAEHRKQHMVCIKLSGGKVAPQPHTAPLEQVGQWVPEFKLPKAKAVEQFSHWCPHAYNSRSEQLKDFTQAIQTTRPEGGAAIVALHDPAGLAMEIAALMEVRKQIFVNHDSVVKPRMTAAAIASLEFSMKEQAKTAEILAGEELARRAEEGPGGYYPSNPALWGVGGDPVAAERWRQHTPAQLQKVADAKWREYTHDRTGKERFGAAASQAWLTSYNDSFKKFDAEQIAPLAQAHVAWLKHKCMVSYMSCNYDSADLASGSAYTATLAAMLKYTADKQPCHDLYVRWLKEGGEAPSNLLLRALSLNQTQFINKLKETDGAPLDVRAFPSDVVVDFFKDGFAKLPAGGKAALAGLLEATGGAVLSYFGAFADGKAPSRAAAAVAAAAGMQFTRLPVQGHRGKFVQSLMNAVYQLDPNLKANPNQLGKAVAAQVRLLEIEGVPMNNTDKRSWLVVLDKAAVKGAAAHNLSGDALAQQLAKAIHKPEDLPALKASSFRAVVASKGFDALGNFAIGVVQCVNITKLVGDYTQAMGHEKADARNRLIAGSVAIAGSFGEAVGGGLQAVGQGKLGNAPGLSTSRVPNALKFGGRLLGLGAGILVGIMDIMKGLEAVDKKDNGLARAYFFGAGLGIGLSIAFFFSSFLGPIGWLIVGLALLALLIVTVFIEKNKDNKVQEWLARCHFGKGADKYKTHAEEQEQLKLAFA
jgi:hypothetical protein